MCLIRNLNFITTPVEDFQQWFEFYYLANNIKADNEAQIARKKALFVTMLGQATFAKLRDLTNPCVVTDLSLNEC